MNPCPICGAAAQPNTAPFCSPRCANVDLGRWLTGQYVVPGQEGEALLDPDEPLG